VWLREVRGCAGTDRLAFRAVKRAARIVFGAHGQLAVGILTFVVAVAAWLYWSFVAPPTVGTVFHISMFFGCVACYSIVATALGYRATERVESAMNGENASGS
jgi:hypothetical protein